MFDKNPGKHSFAYQSRTLEYMIRLMSKQRRQGLEQKTNYTNCLA